jgi:hypothetical protein
MKHEQNKKSNEKTWKRRGNARAGKKNVKQQLQ